MYKVIWLVRFRKDGKREDVLRWWRDGITRIGGALEEYVVSWDSSSDGRVYPEARAAAP